MADETPIPRKDSPRGKEILYQTLFETANDAIFLMRGDRFIECNPRTLQIFGCTREQIIGQPPYRFSPPTQSEGRPSQEVATERIQAVLDGENQFFDWTHIRHDGTPFDAEVSLSRVDLEGDIYIQAIVRDVTARKRAQAALTESEARNQKLESLGVLAGGIAHDFNNILTSALGFLGLAIRRAKEHADAGEPLGKAQRALLRAQKLTQQLLSFSKGGAPVTRIMDLKQVISESVEFALRGANVQANLTMADELWPVEADEGQLGQVLHNLVLNAQQAMPDGGVVRVSARNLPPAGDLGPRVGVAVEDDGAGIPPDILPHIFDPYFTTKREGSGLGLSTAYRIIQAHGGQLAATARETVGTRFLVTLPALPGATPPPPPASGPLPRLSGRILIMDDEASIRELLTEVLTEAGFEAEATMDGSLAVARYRDALVARRPYDLVIMDLTVPGGMGGSDAVRFLRDLHPEVRAIVSSGYSQDPILADPAAAGFDGVVTKPFRIETLLAEVVRVLGLDGTDPSNGAP